MKEREIYDLEVEKGHILALIKGKRVLIDTGSPFSVGEIGLNCVKGKPQSPIPEEQKISLLRSIITLSGVQFDSLLGMDLLKETNFYLNLKDKKIVFSESRITKDQFKYPLSFINNVPIISAVLDGEKKSMIVDTGAVVSYFDPQMTKNKKPIRKHNDFYPLFNVGKFETNIFTMDLEIGNKTVEIEGGILPQRVINALQFMVDSPCLLGNNIFEKFGAEFCFLENVPFLNFVEIGGQN